MKNTLTKITIAVSLMAAMSSCSKFEELNTDPFEATEEQVQVEYFLNNSIIGAQMDPNIAERAFVLYWKTTGRQQFTTGIAGGTYNDDWTKEYWRYCSDWLNHANTAIQVANVKASNGTAQPYNNNLIQVSRIWRAYLMSELSDNFGAIPIVAFEGVNPEFNSTKDVYYYLLEELKDATSKIDVSVIRTDKLKNLDPAYSYDWEKWIRYANSMRLRLAMRISEVDPAKAQTEFEAAIATNKLLTASDQTFQVAERPGWDALSGVMSREWNGQILSTTLNNLYLNLGGIKSKDQLADSLHNSIKEENYAGKRMLGHYSIKNNDPSAGYFFDGLPYSIDPRAYKTFFIPGNFQSQVWSNYPTYSKEPQLTEVTFAPSAGYNTKAITANTKNTWSVLNIGDNGAKGTANGIRSTQIGKVPGLSQAFRTSTNKRIFFANWETYFLIAEASLKGWNTGMSAQAAYEEAVKANFAYWGVSQFANDYLSSESYNRVGTSVKFTHTTEPGASHTVTYVDGYTGTTGTAAMPYPVNNIYRDGQFRNDALTKIITQKYIANMPWLPLEAWNDQRRLGLPFFENPSVENPLPNLPNLTSSNYGVSSIKNFPQRLPYPSNLLSADEKGYYQAVQLLGGPDKVSTPLWWAKQN